MSVNASILTGMTSSLISWAAEGGAEHGQDLPMPPIGYGLVALGFFAFCFAVLWSFRNTAAKLDDNPPAKKKSHH